MEQGNLRVTLERTKQLRKQGNDQQELDICYHYPQWQIIHAKIFRGQLVYAICSCIIH